MNENPTFNQINEQESSAFIHGNDAKPTVLIERSDHRITVGNLDKSTGNVLFSENGRNKMHPQVALEKLSDEHQEMLAAKLAGVALRGSETETADEVNSVDNQAAERLESEIATVEAHMDKLKASMLASDRMPAWQFAVAFHKYETDNASARLSKQGMNQAILYKELYGRLQNLRRQQDNR